MPEQPTPRTRASYRVIECPTCSGTGEQPYGGDCETCMAHGTPLGVVRIDEAHIPVWEPQP